MAEQINQTDPYKPLGILGVLAALSISFFIALPLAEDLTIILLFGWHAFSAGGLRFSNNRLQMLSNGQSLPFLQANLDPILTILIVGLLAGLTMLAASKIQKFLAGQKEWVTKLVLGVIGLALLTFAGWFYWHGAAPINFIGLFPLIEGIVLLRRVFLSKKSN